MVRRDGPPRPRARKSSAVSSSEAGEGPSSSEVDITEIVAAQPEKRPPGRPRRAREIAATHKVRLDARTHADLMRLSDERHRSIHSILLEGIEDVIRKLDAEES